MTGVQTCALPISVLLGYVLGIILSGANADGAAGLQAIARAGGVALVQQPSSAESQAMPQAALNACPDSHVADVAGIAALLAAM